MRHRFGVFKRKRKNSVVWYFWYYDKDGNRQHKSTGQKTKWEAEQFAENWLSSQNEKKKIILEEYAKDYYVWGKCNWIKRRHARGFSLGEAYAKIRRAHLTNYIFPKFGKSALDEINAVQIENWLLDLQLSNSSANQLLGSLRIILREARRERLIDYNPFEDVGGMSRTSYKRRDSLSLKDISLLFPNDYDKLLKIWRRPDFIVIYFVMLTSGMRSGEARVLQWQHIVWDQQGILIVQAQKADKKIGEPKAKEIRAVIVPKRTIILLEWWFKQTPYKLPEDYIFLGITRDRSVTKNSISKEFQKALKRAGIDIGDRNLVAHSLRHTYNTIMKGILTAEMLREFTGHRSEEMTDRYDNPYLIDRLQQFSSSRKLIDKTWEI